MVYNFWNIFEIDELFLLLYLYESSKNILRK